MKKKYLFVPVILTLAALTLVACGHKEEEEFDESFDEVSDWDPDATPDETETSTELTVEDDEISMVDYQYALQVQGQVSEYVRQDPLENCKDTTYEYFLNFLNGIEPGYDAETLETVEPKQEWFAEDTYFMMHDVTLDNRKDMIIVTKDGKMDILQYLEDYKYDKNPGIYVINTDILVGNDSMYLFNLSGGIFEIVDAEIDHDTFNICHVDGEKGVVNLKETYEHFYDKTKSDDVGTFTYYDAETEVKEDISAKQYVDFFSSFLSNRAMGRPDAYYLEKIL